MSLDSTLKTLLTIAWLLPLLGFCIEVFGGYWGTRKSKTAAYIAVFCIAMGFVCSSAALLTWGTQTNWVVFKDHGGHGDCLLYTSPSPRDRTRSRMPSSA